jgi:hypothetical protein
VFVDRSDEIAERAPFKGYGVAVTPGVDGPCALVAGHGYANRLFTWRDGQLRDVAPTAVADEDRHAVGVAAGDLDADGTEELYVHNADSYAGETTDSDLLLDPVADAPDRADGRWRDLFGCRVNAGRDNRYAGRSVAVVDRYGTGRYGVVVAGHGAPCRFYELGDDGALSDMAETVGISLTAHCQSLLAGPIVSERMDLFVGVRDGPNRLFRNDGGHFTEVAATVGLDAPAVDARGVTRVDDALALCSWEGPNCLLYGPGAGSTRPDAGAVASDDGRSVVTGGTGGWRSVVADGTGGSRAGRQRFRDQTPACVAEPSWIRTAVATDFDNDGNDELLFVRLGAANRLFRRHDEPHGSRWASVDPGDAAEPSGLGTGAAVADFDGDGVRELLVVHGEVEPRPVSLYAAADPGDRWLRVRPLTRLGAPARGATVTVETDSFTRRRTICAGSGYLCQMEPVAHVGLGDATPRRLRVRWPDGRERTVERPAVCREHEFHHPLCGSES